MGCDIHCMVEYLLHSTEKGKGEVVTHWWLNFGGVISVDRNYVLFAKMAGVRRSETVKPMFKQRGVPNDVGLVAMGILAKEWARGHSHSWLTLEEFESVLTSYQLEGYEFELDVEWRAMLAAMRTLQDGGHTVRLIFWFDS